MKNRIIKITVLIFCLASMKLCSGQMQMERLLDSIERYLERKTIPGLSLSIVKSDSILFIGGLGYADVESETEVTEEHLFRLGSISKSFTALALFQALKSSPYDLNTPIKKISQDIPFTNQWQEASPVRVVHLLEHTSGFDDFHAHAVYNVKDSILPPLGDMVNSHKKSLFSRLRPGTKKAYSNPNYILAGHLIEIVSALPFNDYLDKNVLGPIGMKSSGYYFKKPDDKMFAYGYKRTGNEIKQIPFATINGSPAGEFCANAKDMGRYLQFMLQRDTTLFSKQEYDRIENPKSSIAAKNGLKFGYGLGNYMIWKNGYLFHGHGGQIDGFTSRYLYSRVADLGLSVAINRNGDANAIADMILNLLLGVSKKVPDTREIIPIPKNLKRTFTGFYELNSPRNELLAFSDKMFGGFSLDFKKNMVVRRRLLGRPRDTLFYAGKNQFYYGKEGLTSALLIHEGSEKPGFWINDNYAVKESRIKRLVIFFGLIISFLLLFSFFVYSGIWLLRNLFKKHKKNAIDHIILFGVGLCLIFMLMGFAGTMNNLENAMKVSYASLSLYISSFLLIGLTIWSILRWSKLPYRKRIRFFYMATSISALAITVYLWNIGFIGLKLWSY